MKILRLSTAIGFALLTTFFFAACKKNKDHDVVKKPVCRIITAAPTPSSTGDAYNISYNSDGKVSKVIFGDNTTTFAYSGNTVISTTLTSGTFRSKDIIALNSNGLAANVKTEESEDGSEWINEEYQYSGTELIKSISTTSDGGDPIVTIFEWTNGNLTTVKAGTAPSTTLEYYTDEPSQPGDYLYLAQLVNGYETFRTKNLLKSISTSGPSVTNFTYTFGADGKISAVDLSGTATVKFVYQYQCN